MEHSIQIEETIDAAETRLSMEKWLRMDRIPHIWCTGCGIGLTVSALVRAFDKLNLDPDQVCIVAGIGCTGRVGGYLRVDSLHVTHGRAIPVATGIKLAKPELTVVVIGGDGDLMSIGGNHFVHAARRNVDITAICVNNFVYAMTGGQVAPTTPSPAFTNTTPYGAYETALNIPSLAESAGARYVARWTALHIRRMSNSMMEAIRKPGLSLVEVVSPCPMYYSRINRLGEHLETMKFYHENSIIKHGEPTENLKIDFQKQIIVGKFVDKPTGS